MKRILFVFIVGLLAGQELLGQGFYNSGAVISIAAQTILSIPDSLVNSGTLINEGDLKISGPWINNGTYVAGNGRIEFNSDIVQTINHNDQNVGRLTISGGGQKRFLANITVESELILESGILVSQNGAKIIFDNGSVITGANDQSYILGPVQHLGAGDWLFPIGNGSAYLPVIVSNVSGAGNGTITLNELTAGETLAGEIDLSVLSGKRFWTFEKAGGNFDQSRITLPLVDEVDLIGMDDLLVVAGSNQPTSGYYSLGQSALVGDLSAGSLRSELTPGVTYYSVAALLEDKGIEIFNGVSVNDDGKNDFMRIRNIEFYPDNTVIIFNRWGDSVFEMHGYDNDQRNFRGVSNLNAGELPAGTYFYSVDLKDGSEKRSGFVVVK